MPPTVSCHSGGTMLCCSLSCPKNYSKVERLSGLACYFGQTSSKVFLIYWYVTIITGRLLPSSKPLTKLLLSTEWFITPNMITLMEMIISRRQGILFLTPWALRFGWGFIRWARFRRSRTVRWSAIPLREENTLDVYTCTYKRNLKKLTFHSWTFDGVEWHLRKILNWAYAPSL